MGYDNWISLWEDVTGLDCDSQCPCIRPGVGTHRIEDPVGAHVGVMSSTGAVLLGFVPTCRKCNARNQYGRPNNFAAGCELVVAAVYENENEDFEDPQVIWEKLTALVGPRFSWKQLGTRYLNLRDSVHLRPNIAPRHPQRANTQYGDYGSEEVQWPPPPLARPQLHGSATRSSGSRSERVAHYADAYADPYADPYGFDGTAASFGTGRSQPARAPTGPLGAAEASYYPGQQQIAYPPSYPPTATYIQGKEETEPAPPREGDCCCC
ncbi:hypothetical protein DFJ74DRAFT_687303 [Hyaloraphidium curvatum]|nr:hypothetical protein DFJ74DRAFT_687303 [Hyaloraphidium curvatum]